MVKSKPSTPDSKKIKKAIGYARVSTDKQKSGGNSIEVQKDAIEKYIDKNELFLIDIFEETKSASKLKEYSTTELLTDRPVLEHILDKARKHEFSDLILYSRDRLARDFYESLIIKSLFIKAKVTIHYISTSEQSSSTNEYIDKFTDLVFSNIAMLEAGLIGQRAKSGQKINVQNGFYASGHVPYGYHLESHFEKKKKIFVKNTTDEIIIARVFVLYNLRFSYSEMIKILKKEFPYETKISFTKSTLSQLINNEMYTGSVVWNRKSKHQLGENDTIVKSVQSDSLKIVPEDIFNKAHEIKNSKIGINNLSYNSVFLLKGKLICGNCDNPLKAKNNGKGKTNVYYCSCNNEKSSNNKKRWTISIPQEKLENYIFNLLYSNLEKSIKDANLLKKYYLVYLSILEKEKTTASKFLDVIKCEIDEIEDIVDSVNKTLKNELALKKEDKNLYIDNFFEAIRNTISLVNIRKNELELQRIETKRILKLVVMTFEEFGLVFDKILSTLLDISSLKTKDFSPSPLRLKRMLIDDVIDKIKVNFGVSGETISIYLKLPNIPTSHNFEFLQTCPIHNILNI